MKRVFSNQLSSTLPSGKSRLGFSAGFVGSVGLGCVGFCVGLVVGSVGFSVGLVGGSVGFSVGLVGILSVGFVGCVVGLVGLVVGGTYLHVQMGTE